MADMDEETRNSILYCVQGRFPQVTDLSFFRLIFESNNWDMDTSLQFLHSVLEDERTSTQNAANSRSENNSNGERVRNPLPNAGSGDVSSTAKAETYAGRIGAIPKSNSSSAVNKSKKASKREKLVKAFNEISSRRNPIERIVKLTEAGIKVIIIMRGCPGSGKSFLVEQLAANLASQIPNAVESVRHHIFSADDFWINPMNNKYMFRAEYLEYAHLWNQKLVRQAASEGRSPLFVDNTHTRIWEMKTVTSIAVEYGYVVEILEPPTEWAFNEDELVRRNNHGVHREPIRRMLERYEHGIKAKHVLTKYNMFYSPSNEPPQKMNVTFDSPASKNQMKIFNNRFHCTSLDLILALKSDTVPLVDLQPGNKKIDNRFPSRVEAEDLLSDDSSLKVDPQPVLIPEMTPNNDSNDPKRVPMKEREEKPVENQLLSEDAVCKMFTDELIAAINRASNEPKKIVNELSGNNEIPKVDEATEAILCKDFSNAGPDQSQPLNESYDDIAVVDQMDDMEACNEFGSLVTKEYVLVNPDGSLQFQCKHSISEPDTLEQFTSSSKLVRMKQKLSKSRNLAKFLFNMSPSKAKNVEYPEKIRFQDIPRSSSDPANVNPDQANASKLAPNDGENWRSGVNYAGEDPSTSWEASSNKSPPSTVMSDSPKEQRPSVKISSATPSNMIDSGSNTNYEDFDLLSKANIGMIHGSNIISASAESFQSATTLPKFDAIKTRATHDKSSMTYSEMLAVDQDSGVQLLARMFPDASVDCLAELLEKCNNKVDWAAGIVMDSGLEMNKDFVATDTLKILCKPQVEKTSAPKDDPVEDLASQINCRKVKKNKSAMNDETAKLLKDFTSKLVLGESHYSERLKKVKGTKLGLTPDQVSNVVQEDDENSESAQLESSTSESSDSLTTEQDEGDKMDVIMTNHFITQLADQFGPVPNLYGSELIVKLPVSIARQIYSYILDAICLQMEEQQNSMDLLVKNDERYARQLQAHGGELQENCSFREIVDHEIALRVHQRETNQNVNEPTMANTLSQRLLIERFPNMDRATLCKVLADTNQSLTEATNLLSSAGHDPVEDSTKPPSRNDSSDEAAEDEEYEMSRNECIRQANAYHDVAAKLNEMKKEYYNKAKKYHDSGNHAVAQFYSEMFAWYSDRIKESNVMAAQAMLLGNEKATTLDLHFLSVSEAICVFDLFLDESIRRLNTRKREIFIITGRGLHSSNGVSKIKPAIIQRLLQRGLKYSEINPGMLKTAITKSTCESYKLLY